MDNPEAPTRLLVAMESLLSRLSAKPALSILLLGLVLLLSGTWILPLMDRDEPRFAEASREMLQRHDAVVPWLNGAYRFDKPPLIYWCQMGCYRLLGESAFAARLPSVFFTVGTALALLCWGRRTSGTETGFAAALIWLTCLQVLVHGRLAVADMAMVFFVTTANWAAWELSRREGARRMAWAAMFALGLSLGFLAKGPVGWLPLGGLILGRALRPAAFRASWPLLGTCVAAALAGVALWGVPALVATHGEFYRVGIGRHVIQRSFDVMEGHGGSGWLGYTLTLPLYFLTFFLSFFPWAFWVPARLKSWWPGRQQDPLGWFLLVQAGLVFGVFCLVRTKLPHYILPAFPCLALWLSRQTVQLPGWRLRLVRGTGAMAVLALAVTLGGFAWGSSRTIAANLWRGVRPHARPEMPIGVAGFNEPSVIWEFRQTVTNYVEFFRPEKAAEFWARPGPRILIVPTKSAAGFSAATPAAPIRVRATGYDTVHFDQYDLTALIRE